MLWPDAEIENGKQASFYTRSDFLTTWKLYKTSSNVHTHTRTVSVCLSVTQNPRVQEAVNKETLIRLARAWITCRHSALGWFCLGSGGVREVAVAPINNTLQVVNMEPLEEYHSPFDFEQGLNTSYLYLSPAYSDTPPSSPAVKTRGNQEEERRGPVEGVRIVCVLDRKTKHGFGSLDKKNFGEHKL